MMSIVCILLSLEVYLLSLARRRLCTTSFTHSNRIQTQFLYSLRIYIPQPRSSYYNNMDQNGYYRGFNSAPSEPLGQRSNTNKMAPVKKKRNNVNLNASGSQPATEAEAKTDPPAAAETADATSDARFDVTSTASKSCTFSDLCRHARLLSMCANINGRRQQCCCPQESQREERSR